MSIIYQERGRYKFVDKNGIKQKFATLEEAIEAGGKEEQVAVSGVPYKVSSSDVSLDENEE